MHPQDTVIQFIIVDGSTCSTFIRPIYNARARKAVGSTLCAKSYIITKKKVPNLEEFSTYINQFIYDYHSRRPRMRSKYMKRLMKSRYSDKAPSSAYFCIVSPASGAIIHMFLIFCVS